MYKRSGKAVKGYRLWCITLKLPRCIVSKDVVFNEQKMLKSYTQKLGDIDKDSGLPNNQIKVELTRKSRNTISDKVVEDGGREADDSNETPDSQKTLQDYQVAKDRERRVIRALKKHSYAYLIAYVLTVAHELDYNEPKSYKEAVSRKNPNQWLKAMKKEMDSLYKNNTWVLVKTRKEESDRL